MKKWTPKSQQAELGIVKSKRKTSEKEQADPIFVKKLDDHFGKRKRCHVAKLTGTTTTTITRALKPKGDKDQYCAKVLELAAETIWNAFVKKPLVEETVAIVTLSKEDMDDLTPCIIEAGGTINTLTFKESSSLVSDGSSQAA